MIAYRARPTIAKLLLRVVAIDVGHTITVVILRRLNLFIFRLLLGVHLHAIILTINTLGSSSTAGARERIQFTMLLRR